jgi:hypothetical protein
VGGARVRAVVLGQALEAVSGSRGEFSLGPVPAALVELEASKPGLAPASLRLGSSEEGKALQLTLHEGRQLSGLVVRGAEGTPVPGAQVSLVGAGCGEEAVADGEGRFRFSGLTPGPYQLRAGDSAGEAVDTVEVQPGTDLDLSLELH